MFTRILILKKAGVLITDHFQKHVNFLFVLGEKSLKLQDDMLSHTNRLIVFFIFSVHLYRIKTIYTFALWSSPSTT